MEAGIGRPRQAESKAVAALGEPRRERQGAGGEGLVGRLTQTLRRRLILLLAIALLVPTAFGIMAAASHYDRQIEQIREATARYAVMASNDEVNLLWQSSRIVQTLSHDRILYDALQARNADAGCQELLRQAIEPYPVYSNIVLYRLDGQPACSAFDNPTLTSAAGEPWFQATLAAKRDQVSDYFFARRLKEPIVIYSAPVFDMTGAMRGLLSMGLRLRWLSQIGQEPGLPSDVVVYLLDGAGTLLVSADGEAPAGGGLPAAALLRQASGGGLHSFDAPGRDGVERHYAVNPIDNKNLYILLGQPTSELTLPLRQELARQIIVLFLVAAGGMTAALIGARLLVIRWITRLTEATRSMQIGQLAIDREFRGAPIELRELGETLRIMAGRIRAREAELTLSLTEKQMMLREVHHRVKNNLQIVTSLLNIYARVPRDEVTKRALADVQMRISALALVHRYLYESQSLKEIDLAPFMNNLCRLLQDGSGIPQRRIRLRVDIPRLAIPGERAVPLALLTTEILTNCFKHAFPAGREGQIDVRMRFDAQGNAELSVSDDGIGNRGDGASGSMGGTLIAAFARQLGGEVTIEGPPGTTVTLRFNLHGPERAVEEAETTNMTDRAAAG